MSDMNPKPTTIILGGKEYGLLFTLNAIDDIQDKFDISIENLTELFDNSKTNIKAIRYLLTVLINEGIDYKNDETGEKTPHVNERFVGRQINAQNMQEAIQAIVSSFSSGAPEGDESPNAQSEQQIN